MTSLLAFLLAIAILVFIHEFGHYIVAKWCNVKVLQFSLGFGPVLFGREFGPDKTRWTLSAIPLGGFVKMLDEAHVAAENTAPIPAEQLPRAFSQKPLWQRSLIVFAGPLFNFLLAIAIYAFLSFVGTSEPAAQLGNPRDKTVAAQIGIRAGDVVTAIDDKPVRSWNDLRMQLLEHAIDKKVVQLSIDNRGATRQLRLPLDSVDTAELEKDFVGKLGIELDSGGIKLGQVQAGGAAAAAGLQAGDVVLSVADKPVTQASELISLIRANPNQPLPLRLLRDNVELTIAVTPASVLDEKTGSQIGKINAGIGNQVRQVTVKHGPLDSLASGVSQTYEASVFSLKMLGKMLTGQLSWKNLSGPITIAEAAGQTARVGWVSYIHFLALISVSLAVLNLLPIPILDGGHLVYYGLEALRGRPLSKRVMDLTQRLGLAVIGLMMVVAITNDIIRQVAS
jgi:regulator of sigma E protease